MQEGLLQDYIPLLRRNLDPRIHQPPRSPVETPKRRDKTGKETHTESNPRGGLCSWLSIAFGFAVRPTTTLHKRIALRPFLGVACPFTRLV